jgi:hypothetical protein
VKILQEIFLKVIKEHKGEGVDKERKGKEEIENVVLSYK